MFYIIYISAAATWMDEAELKKILAVSRKNNEHNFITGLLICAQNTFVQLLEGERRTVGELFEKIKADPRHLDVTIIATGDLKERCFPAWKMGFREVRPDQASTVEDFIEQAKKSTANNDCELPIKLLQSFVRKSKIDH